MVFHGVKYCLAPRRTSLSEPSPAFLAYTFLLAHKSFLWADSTQYMLAFGGMMTMWRKEKMMIMESHGEKM